MEKLLAYESWETIPEQSFAEALDYARQQVDKVLKQESRVIWAAPARFSVVRSPQAQSSCQEGGSPKPKVG